MRHNYLILISMLALAAVACNKETAQDEQIADVADTGLSISGYASSEEKEEREYMQAELAVYKELF